MPMGRPDLRAELLRRTGWSRQVLSKRAQALQGALPNSTDVAHGVLAHRSGIKIARFLDHEELAPVQDALTRLGGIAGHAQPSSRRGDQTPVPRKASLQLLKLPKEFRNRDALLSETKLQEAKEMAAVYPILYVLENSLREVVRRVMTSKYGPSWWDAGLTSGKVKSLKDTSDQRRQKEDQMRWHQRRGAHPIDYISLDDLTTIVSAKQDDFFPDVLGDREYFLQFMRELSPSRNVLCHMNPLDSHNVQDIKVKAERWRKLIQGHLGNIPA
jgi:hypothetical protein